MNRMGYPKWHHEIGLLASNLDGGRLQRYYEFQLRLLLASNLDGGRLLRYYEYQLRLLLHFNVNYMSFCASMSMRCRSVLHRCPDPSCRTPAPGRKLNPILSETPLVLIHNMEASRSTKVSYHSSNKTPATIHLGLDLKTPITHDISLTPSASEPQTRKPKHQIKKIWYKNPCYSGKQDFLNDGFNIKESHARSFK